MLHDILWVALLVALFVTAGWAFMADKGDDYP